MCLAKDMRQETQAKCGHCCCSRVRNCFNLYHTMSTNVYFFQFYLHFSSFSPAFLHLQVFLDFCFALFCFALLFFFAFSIFALLQSLFYIKLSSQTSSWCLMGKDWLTWLLYLKKKTEWYIYYRYNIYTS